MSSLSIYGMIRDWKNITSSGIRHSRPMLARIIPLLATPVSLPSPIPSIMGTLYQIQEIRNRHGTLAITTTLDPVVTINLRRNYGIQSLPCIPSIQVIRHTLRPTVLTIHLHLTITNMHRINSHKTPTHSRPQSQMVHLTTPQW